MTTYSKSKKQTLSTYTVAFCFTFIAALLTSPFSFGQFVECPIDQQTVQNGAEPNIELFKKLIKCKKGEKSVVAGDEGAVLVEIKDIKVGARRPWSYRQDIGSGSAKTLVYLVKATYTVKTLYRAATEIEEGWIRILNFYVNSFGEWQIGSEEPVRAGKFSRISK